MVFWKSLVISITPPIILHKSARFVLELTVKVPMTVINYLMK